MTLKGKKNHYGVKVLRGYGCSIRLKGNKVVLRGGTVVSAGFAVSIIVSRFCHLKT